MNLIPYWALKSPTVQYWQQRLALRKLETITSTLEREMQESGGQDLELLKDLSSRIGTCQIAYDWSVYNAAVTPTSIVAAHTQYLLARLQPVLGFPKNPAMEDSAPIRRMPDLKRFEALQARAEQGRERIVGIEKQLYKLYGADSS